MGKRLVWLDNLKGIGIILVVWGHMNIPLILEHWIYSFHMAMFFVISGYLYNPNNDLKKYSTKKAKNLLIPYLIFAIPSFVLAILKGDGVVNSVLNFFYLNGKVGWNSPIWYFIVLFLVNIIYNTLISIKVRSIFIFAGSLLIGFFIANTGIYPFGIPIVIYGISFFYVGDVLSKTSILNKLTDKKIISLPIFFMLSIIFSTVTNIRVSIYNNEIGNYFVFILGGVTGTIFMMLLVKSIQKIPNIIPYYGKNALVIIGTHYFFLFAFYQVEKIFGVRFLATNNNLIISLFETLFILILSVPLIKAYSVIDHRILQKIK